jgi:hypothetical protein
MSYLPVCLAAQDREMGFFIKNSGRNRSILIVQRSMFQVHESPLQRGVMTTPKVSRKSARNGPIPIVLPARRGMNFTGYLPRKVANSRQETCIDSVRFSLASLT